MDEQKQMEKLNKIFELLDDGKADEAEMAEAFQMVLEVVVKMKEQLEQKMASNMGEITEAHKEMYAEMSDMETKMSDMHAKMSNKMGVDKKEMMDYCKTEIGNLQEMIPSPTDLSSIEDRLKVLETPKPEKPEDHYEARNELEAIDNENEKLKIEAIQNLRKELDEIKKSIKSSGGRALFGGGFNYSAMSIHIIDDETPSGTINGTNAVFTLANLPNPASSVKVYLNGARQRITEDYTLSGVTITFTIAPPTGSILLADYRN